MTRYLTGWRQGNVPGDDYFGFQDGGESFGKVVAQTNHGTARGVPGVSWTVVKKPEFIRTCEVKSVLCRLRNLVKSLEHKIVAEVLEGSRPITNGGEHLTLWFRELWVSW